VYGDGSAGPLYITSPTDWSTIAPANGNFQFTNIVISSTLTVPGGIVLRALGNIDITNTGSIIVSPGFTTPVPHAGIAMTPSTYNVPGVAIPPTEAYFLTHPPAHAGGNGVGLFNIELAPNQTLIHAVVFGGPGGGSLVLRAAGSININGTVTANGADGALGGAGGGGGVVVLAAKGGFSGSGIINAQGGAGSETVYSFQLVGGGGGGGVVLAIGPNANSFPVPVNLRGGASGPVPGGISMSIAGGSSGGTGGTLTQAATSGLFVPIQVTDPAPLFF
jgi:hypothetical protein